MKVAVVLTGVEQCEFASKTAFLWRQFFPDAQTIYSYNGDEPFDGGLPYVSASTWSGCNPGYYAPPGILHGHHLNLNHGVAFALMENPDLVVTTCSDIAPNAPHALVEAFLASGKPCGITKAPWGHIPRYQDDLMLFTADGAAMAMPIRTYDVDPYYSEISLGAHIDTIGIAEEIWHPEAFTVETWRPFWFQEHGFTHLGPERSVVYYEVPKVAK